MPETIVIDTDILIDAGRKVSDAVACLEQIEQRARPAISAMSEMELIVGLRTKAELRALENFLSRFQIIPLNEQTSILATDLLRRYRLSHGLLIADAIIAATALSRNVSFITKNQRDYRFITGLNLLPYPKPF